MFTTTTAPSPKAFVEGMIHLLQGDKPRAQAEFERARVISEKSLQEVPETLLDTRSMDLSLQH